MTLNVTYEVIPLRYVEQKIIERIIVEAVENGKTRVLKLEKIGKLVFPQEFLEQVDRNGKFEFISWYNNFDLKQPLEKATKFNRPMTILRRK